jgi:hypothetical protein
MHLSLEKDLFSFGDQMAVAAVHKRFIALYKVFSFPTLLYGIKHKYHAFQDKHSLSEKTMFFKNK